MPTDNPDTLLQGPFEHIPETTITIAATATDSSDSGELEGWTCVGVHVDKWTSGKMTFQTSFDGGTTWRAVKDEDGAAVEIGTMSGAAVVSIPSKLLCCPRLKVISENAQDALVTVKLILKEVH